MDREPIYSVSLPSGEQIQFFGFDEIKSHLDDEQKQLYAIISEISSLGLKPSKELFKYNQNLNELVGHAKRLSNSPAISGELGAKFLRLYRDFMEPGEQSADRYAGRSLRTVNKLVKQGKLSGVEEKICQILGLPSAFVDPLAKPEENPDDDEQKFRAELIQGSWDADPWMAELKNRADTNSDNIASVKQQLGASELRSEQLSNEVDKLRQETKGHIDQVQRIVVKAENAHSALQDKLALDKAAKYWSGIGGKQRKHITRFRWFLGSLLVWLASSVCVLWYTLEDYRNMVINADNFYDLVPYLPTNILLVLLAVWGARVLVRLILSENHLATRAEEKGVLIQTYLALVNQGAAEKEDRSTILASIFSHTQDGLVQEDGMPAPGLLNSITKTNN